MLRPHRIRHGHGGGNLTASGTVTAAGVTVTGTHVYFEGGTSNYIRSLSGQTLWVNGNSGSALCVGGVPVVYANNVSGKLTLRPNVAGGSDLGSVAHPFDVLRCATVTASGTVTGGAATFTTINGSGLATISNSLNVAYSITCGTGSNAYFKWFSKSAMGSSVDGNITFYNAGLNDFGRLSFGGITSSFPAIKRNGAAINIRLADDSADAPLTCSNLTASGTVQTGSYVVNTLPPTPSIGMRAQVTDSSVAAHGHFGATVAGWAGQISFPFFTTERTGSSLNKKNLWNESSSHFSRTAPFAGHP
jgi:hypothetical protein